MREVSTAGERDSVIATDTGVENMQRDVRRPEKVDIQRVDTEDEVSNGFDPAGRLQTIIDD